jgi:hypothetical protein
MLKIELQGNVPCGQNGRSATALSPTHSFLAAFRPTGLSVV